MILDLSEDEVDMLRGIVKFYLGEQSFVGNQPLRHQINDLYDKISSTIPNKGFGDV